MKQCQKKVLIMRFPGEFTKKQSHWEGIITLPETNELHLKIGGWKINFLLGPGLFLGGVCC